MTVSCCPHCPQKDEEILYLRALLSLETVSYGSDVDKKTGHRSETADILQVKQKQALLRKQLALIRADVQYMNRHVQSVIDWIIKIIGIFLACCGRIGQTTASVVVETASRFDKNVYKSPATQAG